MTRLIYLLPIFLMLVLVPTKSLRAQEIKYEIAPLTEEAGEEVVVSSPVSKNVALSNLAMTRFGDQTGQTNTGATNNNSGYVFPSAKHRFNRYVKSTIGPFSLLRSAASAGIQQWDNSPLEWGQGMEGYGKRFASTVGSNAIRQTVTYGLSEAFKLDTGFEKSKHTKFWPRLKDALVQNVTSRTRSGKRVLSAPILVGTYAGTIIPSETWYPERYSYKDGLRGGSYSLLFGFGINIVREFIFNW
jgi:hypothetical protein